MSYVQNTELAGGRLTRRGFLGGMVLVSAAALVACSGGAAAPAANAPPAAPSNTGAVKMTDANKFDPDTVTITKGGTVTWTNSSTMMHSVTDDPAKAANKADALLPDGGAAWDSGILNPGATFTHTFDVAGTYKYFCVPHEALGMLGTITVQ
jgi:plastocyanin